VKKSPTTADARGWEELAQLDPLWAVASSPRLRLGKWDEQEFYEAGRRKVRKLAGEKPRHEGVTETD